MIHTRRLSNYATIINTSTLNHNYIHVVELCYCIVALIINTATQYTVDNTDPYY